MGLEAATYINQLNAAWPVGATDPKSQGDDHLRLIKSTLQASFPNITGAMVRTHTELNTVGASGISGFAAPSNLVGLNALAAGVATTGVRSDATFKIDEAITPTWSATHRYTKNGSGSNTSAIGIQAANAVLYLKSTTAAADRKNARVYSSSGAFVIDWQDDAESVARDAVRITLNSGATALAFGNTTDNPSYQFLGSSTVTIGGNITSNGAGTNSFGGSINISGAAQKLVSVIGNGNSYFQLGDSTRAVDEKYYLLIQSGKDLFLSAYDDSKAASRSAIVINRGTGIQISNINFGNATDNNTFTFLGSGTVTVGGVVKASNGAVGSPSYSYTNDATSGEYRIGASNIGRSIAGALVSDWTTQANGSMRVADYGGTLQVVGYRNIPQNSQSANYTCVLADAGKHILHPSGGGAGDVFTIPANASVAYDIGTVLTFVNADSNSVQIAITTDTMTLAGTTTTGTRTLGQNGVATAIKVTSTSWIISGTALS